MNDRSNAPRHALLEVEDLEVHYGQLQALWGVSLRVEKREAVGIIGANGAGKSTLLRTIAGSLVPTRGKLWLRGEPTPPEAWRVNRAGVSLVPEGRRVFASLSAEENLRVSLDHSQAARRFSRPDRSKGADEGLDRPMAMFSLADIYSLFPSLERVRKGKASQLSGGEQQMLAIGRALVSQPDLLLVDELSLGLAPSVIRVLYAKLADIKARGLSLLFVEQDVKQCLEFADRVYVLRQGRVTLQGGARDLSYDAVRDAYFGP
jgi:branched-chain amino acid transport system ATP-binding protein